MALKRRTIHAKARIEEPIDLDKLPPFLTIAQASRVLNTHPQTLRDWDKKKILVPRRIGIRGDRRYPRSQILQILDKGMN